MLILLFDRDAHIDKYEWMFTREKGLKTMLYYTQNVTFFPSVANDNGDNIIVPVMTWFNLSGNMWFIEYTEVISQTTSDYD